MKFVCISAVIFGVLMMVACGGSNSAGSTENSDSSSATAKTDTMQVAPQPQAGNPSPEQSFINYAVPGNTLEIVWLKAGMTKTANKDIKSHAKMMLKDHEQLDTKVKNYLTKNGSTLNVPAVDTTNAITINDKMGKDWDKAWVDKMVEDHSGLLDRLKNSQKDVKDTALLTLINNTIPVVESHLAMAKSMQVKM
jgi:putative membrane protein